MHAKITTRKSELRGSPHVDMGRKRIFHPPFACIAPPHVKSLSEKNVLDRQAQLVVKRIGQPAEFHKILDPLLWIIMYSGILALLLSKGMVGADIDLTNLAWHIKEIEILTNEADWDPPKQDRLRN